ncbi:MAG: phage portal protein [Chloroflexi bacterium]|nr:phage portal protein [Chloroflexota bacterium]
MARLFERRDVTVVGDDLWRSWKSIASLAGVNVDPETAMNFSAVFLAHKILGESTAMLPLFLLRRMKDGKEPAREHPLFGILHDVANPEMDAYLVRETLTTHMAGWGRAHAKVDYDADGRITAIWPIPPNLVTVTRDRFQRLAFEVNFSDGQKKTYRKDEMLFLRGMSSDGINCYSPVQQAREGIGLALAAEGYGAAFFGNGAIPGGVLEHPGTLDEEPYNRIYESWNGRHGGVSNANKIAILEEGMKYHAIGLPPGDAQFLQTRAFAVEEIARWYRLPSMMLNLAGANSTYASVEAFGLQFVLYTLYPWLVRWEKSISMQLLLERERKELFAEHLMTALLRGDTASRYQAYAIARQWGWLSVNEIRGFENLNAIKDGDVYLSPLNMAETGKPADRPARSLIQRSFLPVMTEAVQRAFKREQSDVTTAGAKVMQKKGAEGFADWLADFYNEQRDFMVRTLATPAHALAEAIGQDVETPSNDVVERVDSALRLAALRHSDQALMRLKSGPIEAAFEDYDPDRTARWIVSQVTAALLMPKEPEWQS